MLARSGGGMNIGTTLLGASAWLACTGALAADKAPTSEARAEAARIITAGDAGAYFIDASDGEAPAVRHLRSGLTCVFQPDEPRNKVTIYPSGGPDPIPAGDDVSCLTHVEGYTVSLYATRYRQPTSVDEQMGVAVASIRQVFTDVRPYKGTGADMTVQAAPGEPAVPSHKTARFIAKLDGRKVYTRASVAQVNDWIVLERVTGPSNDPLAADLLAELTLNSAIESVMQGPKPTI
jgi:hypothetical protein